jgi:hypothetical protein
VAVPLSDVLTSDRGFIWRTAGMADLAESVLGGTITQDLENISKRYEGIEAYFKRREANATNSISPAEMVRLAKDLIRATAEKDPLVGDKCSAPL